MSKDKEEDIKDREEDLIFYIKKFIDKHGFGPRSEDLIKEFTPKPWSSRSSLFTHLGKLVDQEKLEKKADPKKAEDRYPRYYIKKSFEKETTKIVIANNLRKQELSETELPSQTTFNFFFNSIKKQVDVVRHSSLNPLDKLGGKRGEFYGNFYAQFFANRYSKYIKLNIMHLKGQKPPNLDVAFGRIKKIQGMKVLDVLHYCFVSVAGEYEREMAHALPFQLLLTYDPPPINHEDLLKEVSMQTKDLYQKWLLKFNQKDSARKNDEFGLELSEYIKEIHERRLKALQKS